MDFDLTIVDIHTGGRWRGPAKELATEHIRPEMKCLINTSIDTDGLLKPAIASFSAQPHLIQEVISIALPKAKNMTIVGGRNRSERDGKSTQLQAITLAYNNNNDQSNQNTTTITNNSRLLSAANMILIDDDKSNVKTAKEGGYYAIWFDLKNPKDLFGDILQLEDDKRLK